MYSHFFVRYGVNLNALPAGTRSLLGLRVRSNTHVNAGPGVQHVAATVA